MLAGMNNWPGLSIHVDLHVVGRLLPHEVFENEKQ